MDEKSWAEELVCYDFSSILLPDIGITNPFLCYTNVKE